MLRQPDHLRSASIGHGTTAVLNINTGTWVWMDTDTRRIWDAALAGGSALRTLIDTLVARGHDAQQAQSAVDAAVATLHGHGLLVEHRAASRRPLWRRVIPCR